MNVEKKCVGRGGISATIIADSMSPYNIRLTTLELVYPRFIHAEVMTHRMLSKNAASTRAVPVNKVIQSIRDAAAMPIHWGKNNPGMSSKQELDVYVQGEAKHLWQETANLVCEQVSKMSDPDTVNGHKQWAGRWLEPATFIKVVVSGTEFANLFSLRLHKDSQPEFYELAHCIKSAMDASVPVLLKQGQWHLPYVSTVDDRFYVSDPQNNNMVELTLDQAVKVSVSCCAQVSYRALDTGIEKAERIFQALHLDEDSGEPAHASPTEHQAVPMNVIKHFPDYCWEVGVTHMRRDQSLWSGNFRGWIQHRQLISNEAVW